MSKRKNRQMERRRVRRVLNRNTEWTGQMTYRTSAIGYGRGLNRRNITCKNPEDR